MRVPDYRLVTARYATIPVSNNYYPIFKALSTGKISPSETGTLIQSVAIEAKIYETEKLKQGVERLEAIVAERI